MAAWAVVDGDGGAWGTGSAAPRWVWPGGRWGTEVRAAAKSFSACWLLGGVGAAARVPASVVTVAADRSVTGAYTASTDGAAAGAFPCDASVLPA